MSEQKRLVDLTEEGYYWVTDDPEENPGGLFADGWVLMWVRKDDGFINSENPEGFVSNATFFEGSEFFVGPVTGLSINEPTPIDNESSEIDYNDLSLDKVNAEIDEINGVPPPLVKVPAIPPLLQVIKKT